MDNFGKTINQHLVKLQDPLKFFSKNSAQNATAPINTPPAKAFQDSFRLSQQDIERIVETIKDYGITRFIDIKDIIGFKEAANFDIESLTDFQRTRIIAAIQENIEEKFFDTMQSHKLGLSQQETQIINRVISQIGNYPVRSIEDAIRIVQQSLLNNPELLQKIAPVIVSMQKNQIEQFNFNFNFNLSTALNTNISIPGLAGNINKFSSNVKQNLQSNLSSFDPTIEVKKYLSAFINNVLVTKNKDNTDPLTTAIFTPGTVLYELNKKINSPLMDKLKFENAHWFHSNIIEKDASYIADIVSKVGNKYSSSILSGRLLGEISGTTVAAIGTASLVSSMPALGLTSSLALTMMVAMAGAIIGRITGEGIGKIIVGPKYDEEMPEEYTGILDGFFERSTGTAISKPTNQNIQTINHEVKPATEKNKEQETNKEEQKNESKQSQEKTETKPVEQEDKSAFNYIKKDAVETLKGIAFYKKGAVPSVPKDLK